MKRVILLKSRLQGRGGLEKHAGKIIEAFLARGVHVDLLTGTPVIRAGVTVHTTPLISWPAFIRLEQFDAFCQNFLQYNKADIVFGMDRNRDQTHIRAGNGVHAAYLESRKFTDGKLKQLQLHFNPLHRKILELEKSAFVNPALQKIFTNSHLVKNQILSYYDADPKKIEVIHNGVEWNEMENDFRLWPEKKTASRYEFLFIGNGYTRKGLLPLLKALSLLKTKEFHLSVVGKDKELAYFKHQTALLGLQNQVTFFGPVQSTIPFYQKADALVIPSFYDPFANVTVEALAMGLLVLSSKYNGGSEILPKNQIFETNTPECISFKLEEAMKQKKTIENATLRRNSIKHLDFSNQLKTLVDSTLNG